MVVQETFPAQDTPVDDPKLEFWICVVAIPATLLLGLFFHAVMPGVQRIFFGMPLHELGHAVAAWFCGFFAIPTLWKTVVFSESRGWLMPVVLFGAIAFGMVKAWRAEKYGYLPVLLALLVAQGIGTFYIREETAQMLFTWGGDGFGMVLAAALMATFFFGKRTELYKGWLRWGFLVIGAAAFSDMFGTWWAARSNRDAIPFGEIEGVGLSDPMKLLEEHGWEIPDLVRRYFVTGLASLGGLALVYAWGVLRARSKAHEKK